MTDNTLLLVGTTLVVVIFMFLVCNSRLVHSLACIIQKCEGCRLGGEVGGEGGKNNYKNSLEQITME